MTKTAIRAIDVASTFRFLFLTQKSLFQIKCVSFSNTELCKILENAKQQVSKKYIITRTTIGTRLFLQTTTTRTILAEILKMFKTKIRVSSRLL